MKLLKYFFKSKKHKIKAFLNRNAIIIDVRSQHEWNNDHIINATHIPLTKLNDHIENLKQNNTPIIVHCKSGLRSAKATKLLKSYNIEAINGGGIADLREFIT